MNALSAGLSVANFKVWARFATAEGRRKKLVKINCGDYSIIAIEMGLKFIWLEQLKAN